MDYGQETVFGPKVISTVGYDEQEMIRDILYLHSNGHDIDCDPTFSTGNFYHHGIPLQSINTTNFRNLVRL